MKKTILFLLIAYQTFAQAPEVVWTVGSIGGDITNAYVRSMRPLPNGDFYVHYTATGVRRSVAQHVLTCYKPTGEQRWQKNLGSDLGSWFNELSYNDPYKAGTYPRSYVERIQFLPDNRVYVFGNPVRLITPEGTELIKNTLEGGLLQKISNGNYVVVSDSTFTQTDTLGNVIFKKDLPQKISARGVLLLQTSKGEFIIQDEKWIIKLNAQGDYMTHTYLPLPTDADNSQKITRLFLQPTSDGFLYGLYLSSYNSASSDSYPVYLFSFDNNLGFKWRSNGKMNPSNAGPWLQSTSLPNSIFVVSSDTLIKTDAKGDIVWKKLIDPAISHIKPTDDGGCVVAGKQVVYFESNGNIRWQQNSLFASTPNATILSATSSRTLILHYNMSFLQRLFVLNERGDIIQNLDSLNYVSKLTDGNYLLSRKGKMLKFNQLGIFEWEQNSQCYYASLAPDGTYILFGNGQTTKIKSTGEVIWSVNIDGDYYATMFLKNGNTLLVSSKTRLLVDSQGKIAWQLSNGENIPTPDQGQLLLGKPTTKINAEGQIEWQHNFRSDEGTQLEDGSYLFNQTVNVYGDTLYRINRDGSFRWKTHPVGQITSYSTGLRGGARVATLLKDGGVIYMSHTNSTGYIIPTFLTKLDNEQYPQVITLIEGRADLCPNGSVVLQVQQREGFLYQWKKDGVSLAGATQPKYRATAAGTYEVAIQDTKTNVSYASQPFKVTLRPQVNAASLVPSGKAIFCQSGGTITITPSLPENITYSWQKNGVPLTTHLNYLSVQEPGSYTATLADTVCKITTSLSPADITIAYVSYAYIVPPLKTTVNVPETIKLEANLTVNIPIQWLKDEKPIDGATSLIYEASTSGSYSFVAQAGNCQLRATPISITISPITAIYPTVHEQVQLFPNPTNRFCQVNVQVHQVEPVLFELFDMQGYQQLQYLSETNATQHQVLLDMNSLTTGVYLLKIVTSNTIFMKRIVKY